MEVAERFSCMETLCGSLKLFCLPTNHFVPLNHGKHSVKAAAFSPLGGAGFTAQSSASEMMQMVPEGRL